MVTEFNQNLLEDIEINVPEFLQAVQEKTDYAIFQDSFGDGVALIANKSYGSYHDIAAEFEINILDYAV